MKGAKVKNDREFDVEITVKDESGEEVKKTLKPGEETEVPEDQAQAVLTQITDAEAPKSDDDKDGDDDDKDGKKGDDADKSGKTNDGAGDADKKGGDADKSDDADKAEKEELARLRKENAEFKLSERYNKLLQEGKITPAQKDKFMELSQVSGKTVNLSGKQVDLSELVAGILEAGPKVVKFSEDGSSKGDDADKADKKPSEKLSKEERAGMEAVGADPKRADELAEKYPEMRKQLEGDEEKK